MPDFTAKHLLTYPLPGDTLATADDVMKALATRLDLLLGEHAALVVNVAAANTNQTQRVNYERSYAAAEAVPVAMVWLGAAPGAAGNVAVWSSGHDATGFTLGIRSGAAGNHTVRYGVRF